MDDKNAKIYLLFMGRKKLFNKRVLDLDYDVVNSILSLKEWEDPRYKYLLTSTIWKNANLSSIRNILHMKEWENPKYEGLLTSSIWGSSYENVRDILSLEEWEDPKYSRVLTSSIWLNNCDTVKRKLHLPCFESDKYKHLLTPTIFTIKDTYILGNTKLFEEYGISDYITVNCIRRTPEDNKILLDYLKSFGVPFILQDKDGNKSLNPIIYAGSSRLKNVFGIDLKALREERGKVYSNGSL